MRLPAYILLFFCSLPGLIHAQPCKTAAKFINSKADFLATIKADPGKALVDLKRIIPSLLIEMPYATPHNFTRTVLYNDPIAYLRRDPANALKDMQDELRSRGLSIKIYDAYRPLSVSCRMWQLIGDSRYVADPAKGSDHNRGLAVDLTLIDLKSGKELDMGTDFDHFTDSAHHTFTHLPAVVLANRKLLKEIMSRHGFNSLETEWWHYSWRIKAGYEVLDLDLDELSKQDR